MRPKKRRKEIGSNSTNVICFNSKTAKNHQNAIPSYFFLKHKINLTPVERKILTRMPTSNLDAFDSYLKARKIHYQFDQIMLPSAFTLYEEAIRKDPDFAEAHAHDALLAALVYSGSLYGVLDGVAARHVDGSDQHRDADCPEGD